MKTYERATLGTSFVMLVMFYAIYWQTFPGYLVAGDDGWISEWTAQFLLAWGEPFDLSVINPFQGMGSLFVHITPWFNPASWVYAFDLQVWERQLAVNLLLLVEFLAVGYWAFRRFGATPLVAAVGVQLAAILIFPGTSNMLGRGCYLCAMFYTSHYIVVMLLAVVGFMAIGRLSRHANFALLVGLLVYCLLLMYTMGVYVAVFAPPFVILSVCWLAFSVRERSELYWKLGLVAAVLALFFLSGFFEFLYWSATAAQRTLIYNEIRNPDRDFAATVEAINLCQGYGNITLPWAGCYFKLFHFFYYAVVLASVGLLFCRDKLSRVLGATSISMFAFLYFFTFVTVANWFQTAHQASHMTFFYETIMMVFALTLVLFVARALMFVRSLHAIRTVRPAEVCAKRDAFLRIGGVLVFCVALVFYSLRHDLVAVLAKPDADFDNSRGFWSATLDKSAILDILDREIRLDPDKPFGGSVTTIYASGGPLSTAYRQALGEELYQQKAMTFYFWVFGRTYATSNQLGSHYQGQHFWQRGIPTLDEYSQWASPLLTGLAMALFSNGHSSQSANYILFMKPRLELLQLFGLRYIVTDAETSFGGRDFVASIGNSFRLYMYELADPNTGNYSPTHAIFVPTAKAAAEQLIGPNFNARSNFLVDKEFNDDDLVPADSGRFFFKRNKLVVEATSPARSMIVLPFNFSNCLSLKQTGTRTDAELHRVNLTMTGIEFSGELRAEIEYDFDLFGSAGCRKKDFEDYERLDWLELSFIKAL